MTHRFPPLRFERPGIGSLSVGRPALRDTAGDLPCGAEARFCRCFVPRLPQPDLDEGSRASDRAIQGGPAAFDFEGGFLDPPPRDEASGQGLKFLENGGRRRERLRGSSSKGKQG
jgi:hypothetical protein